MLGAIGEEPEPGDNLVERAVAEGPPAKSSKGKRTRKRPSHPPVVKVKRARIVEAAPIASVGTDSSEKEKEIKKKRAKIDKVRRTTEELETLSTSRPMRSGRRTGSLRSGSLKPN